MIKVALFEDNLSFSNALELLFLECTDMELVRVERNLSSIEKVMEEAAPDVILMDIDFKVGSGIEGVKLIKKKSPHANILMLTVFEDEDKIFQSLKAGAAGYLLKKDGPEKILDGIRRIYNGESVINGHIARKVVNYFTSVYSNREDVGSYNLTKRETEIFNLLNAGHSYKQIASMCNISIDTLYSHIKKLYSKLNVHSRSEIAARFRA